jgi:hypothetical protein
MLKLLKIYQKKVEKKLEYWLKKSIKKVYKNEIDEVVFYIFAWVF